MTSVRDRMRDMEAMRYVSQIHHATMKEREIRRRSPGPFILRPFNALQVSLNDAAVLGALVLAVLLLLHGDLVH